MWVQSQTHAHTLEYMVATHSVQAVDHGAGVATTACIGP